MSTPAIDTWHQLITERNVAALDEILADDAVFHSPVVHTPQKGKQLTKMYLSAAIMVLGNSEFTYVREVVGDSDAV
ncbi:MAG: nuclear transport factor 2 family protein, partial [Deltaproteobacteria bacterium]